MPVEQGADRPSAEHGCRGDPPYIWDSELLSWVLCGDRRVGEILGGLEERCTPCFPGMNQLQQGVPVLITKTPSYHPWCRNIWCHGHQALP